MISGSTDELFSFSEKLFTSSEWAKHDMKPFDQLRDAWRAMRDELHDDATSKQEQ